MMATDENLLELMEELARNLQLDDLPLLIEASKEDKINPDELKKLSSPKQWLLWLCEKGVLKQDDVSFIEHIFESCRRPDLLTIILEYRMKNLTTSEDDIATKHRARIPSARKYEAYKLPDLSEISTKAVFELRSPPKSRRKSSSC